MTGFTRGVVRPLEWEEPTVIESRSGGGHFPRQVPCVATRTFLTGELAMQYEERGLRLQATVVFGEVMAGRASLGGSTLKWLMAGKAIVSDLLVTRSGVTGCDPLLGSDEGKARDDQKSDQEEYDRSPTHDQFQRSRMLTM